MGIWLMLFLIDVPAPFLRFTVSYQMTRVFASGNMDTSPFSPYSTRSGREMGRFCMNFVESHKCPAGDPAGHSIMSQLSFIKTFYQSRMYTVHSRTPNWMHSLLVFI